MARTKPRSVAVKMSTEEREDLERKAREAGVTISEFVRRAVSVVSLDVTARVEREP